MQLNSSKTQANLLAAFAGESQARNKYTYYAAKARKDGYEQIAEIFEETANNEKEHAEIWWKLLSGGAGPTELNLDDAAKGENYEWSTMYKNFAQEAREEGFNNIAVLFELVAKIEQTHEERFQKLSGNIKDQKVFEKEEETIWICRNCGHIHKGKNAPKACPVCSHEQAFFQVRAENY
ncbi:MAG: rubrerythrin family protein [Clostridia bacterium]|nr:rubrerythrin family protein [Clostridia bacterium]